MIEAEFNGLSGEPRFLLGGNTNKLPVSDPAGTSELQVPGRTGHVRVGRGWEEDPFLVEGTLGSIQGSPGCPELGKLNPQLLQPGRVETS